MRILGPVLAVLFFAQAAVGAKPCSKLTKELSELRLEYHLYATGRDGDSERDRDIGRTRDAEDAADDETTSEIGFDRLAEMLDKIIELKREMRKTGCKLLPRKKDLERQLKKRARREAESRR